MLEIPVKVGVSVEETKTALLKAVAGDLEDLNKIVGAGGRTLKYTAEFNTEGVKDIQFAGEQLNSLTAETKKIAAEAQKLTKVQKGSLTSLRQQTNYFKQQRDALATSNPLWAQYNQKVIESTAAVAAANGVQQGSIAALQAEQRELTNRINKEALSTDERARATQEIARYSEAIRRASGVEAGSISDLKTRREELLKLRDSISSLGDGRNKISQVNEEISNLDRRIASLSPKAGQLISLLGKIATVQSGFIAINSIIRSFTGFVDQYVSRVKQVEAFNLALTNVGFTATESSATLEKASATAAKLGAPIRQVEKAYIRMIPALQAVGASAQETDRFIEQISARTQTLGLTTEESGRLIEAFAQVLSKGKLQSEELTQQISELDGAFRKQLADAIGVNIFELTSLVQAGEITADKFVEAVNKMENGAEELAQRVRDGRATIQQLQNAVQRLQVENLQEIGKILEPAAKSFIEIARVVQIFISELSQTEAFRSAIVVFNNIAKGLEVFVIGLTRAISLIATIVNPIFSIVNAVLGLGEGFGGVVGAITILVASLATLKAALGIGALLKLLQKNFIELATSTTSGAKSIGVFNAALRQIKSGQISVGISGLAAASRQAASGFINLGKTALSPLGKALSNIPGLASKAGRAIGQLSAITKGAQRSTAGFAREQVNISAFNDRIIQSNIKLEGTLRARGVSEKQLFRRVIANSVIQKSYYAQVVKGQQLTAAQSMTWGQALSASFTRVGRAAGLSAISVKNFKIALASIINPVTIAFIALGTVISGYTEITEAGKEGTKAFGETIRKTNSALDSYKKSSEIVAKANQTTTKSATASGIAFGALSAVLLGLAIAAAPKTLGASLLLYGKAAALGAVGFVSLTKAIDDLKIAASAGSIEEASTEAEKVIDKLKKGVTDLGISLAGVNNFESFNTEKLEEANTRIADLVEQNRSYVNALQEVIKKQEESERPNATVVEQAREKLVAAQNELAQAEKVQASIRAENEERIRLNKNIEGVVINLKELEKIQSSFNTALEQAVTEEETEAMRKYGNSLENASKLEGALLGIQKEANAQRINQLRGSLAALQNSRIKNKEAVEDQIEREQELSNELATELKKREELQKQYEQALASAFEKGAQNARDLASVYRESGAAIRSAFTGVLDSLSSLGGQALSLIDTIVSRETEGLKQGGRKRKEIITEQLKAAVRLNEFETRIAQLKLRTTTAVAVAEARSTQARFRAEAQIARLKGQSQVAAAFSNAASQQDKVIAGLRLQSKLESDLLNLKKITKDQEILASARSEKIKTDLGVQKVSLKDAIGLLDQIISKYDKQIDQYGDLAATSEDAALEIDLGQFEEGQNEVDKFKSGFEDATVAAGGLESRLQSIRDYAIEARKEIEAIAATLNNKNKESAGRTPPRAPVLNRAMGGPVAAGVKYFVNDGGGREAFVNSLGRFSMLPASRNTMWTAPSSGSIIPAGLVDDYRRNSDINSSFEGASVRPRASISSSMFDSGNLVKQIGAGMKGSNTTQRITNNITIQSQEPVMDASKLMSNVAKMRARRGMMR